MEEKIKQANPTLHRYLFTVTTFSKLLTMFLFVLLPFIGFYLGMQYQQRVTVAPVVSGVQKPVTPSPTPLIDVSSWKTYENTNYYFSFSYPLENKYRLIEDHSLIRVYENFDSSQTLIFQVSIYNISNPDSFVGHLIFQEKYDELQNISIGKGTFSDPYSTYKRAANININGVESFVFEGYAPKTDIYTKDVVFKKDGLVYVLSGVYSNTNIHAPKNLSLYENILSTFKFNK